VGSLFIASGLVKVVDPLGFSYKLEEYFTVFGTDFMNPLSLFLSMFFSVLEIALGITVLMGVFAIMTAILLLALIVFFTFLTGFSAVTGKVTDCGCFGDALKLTPWESFYKDVVLLIFVAIIFVKRKAIQINTLRDDAMLLIPSFILVALFSMFMLNWNFPILFTAIVFVAAMAVKSLLSGTARHWGVTAVAAIIAAGLTWYCWQHLPIKDFRPYAVGKSITEGMAIPEGAPEDEYQVIYTMRNKTTGEETTITDKEYINEKWWEKKEWELLKDKTESILIKEGYDPPIHDFNITDGDGNDRTDDILSRDKVLLVIAYDLKKANKASFEKINPLAAQCEKQGIDVIALTASLDSEVEQFRHEVQAAFPFYNSDATALKTIIRSNPGLMLISKGTILGKWHHNDVPDFENLQQRLP